MEGIRSEADLTLTIVKVINNILEEVNSSDRKFSPELLGNLAAKIKNFYLYCGSETHLNTALIFFEAILERLNSPKEFDSEYLSSIAKDTKLYYFQNKDESEKLANSIKMLKMIDEELKSS